MRKVKFSTYWIRGWYSKNCHEQQISKRAVRTIIL